MSRPYGGVVHHPGGVAEVLGRSCGWTNAGSSVNGTSRRYKYVATAGQTSFSGADVNSNVLAYDAGYVDCYLNGIRLDPSDITATSGTAIVLASGAAAGDELNIIAFGTFSVSNFDGGGINAGTVSYSKLTPDVQGSMYGFKNRIINGAMQIDQRNAGASVTPTDGQYLVDRWKVRQTTASKFSAQQNAGSVTPPVGFTNYLGATSLSAYSVGATDAFTLMQYIEGFNVADLGFGTANAKTVTLSFQVYSSLTGTFGGAVLNSPFNRSYPFTYSIPVANTWTTISVTIAGDTTGTWAKDNTTGLIVSFGLGVGSTYSGAAGAWGGSGYYSATGATSVVGTNGATFYITGVQLEKGSTATSFDYRPYGTELALCQRYYQKSFPHDTAPVQNSGISTVSGNCLGGGYGTLTTVRFATVMRSGPTITGFNPSAANDRVRNNSIGADIQYVGIGSNYNSGFVFYPYGANHDSGVQGYQWAWNWTASAEL